MYPNLYVVGPPRSGTTSLIEWLARHPQIGQSEVKEPMFHTLDLESPQRTSDRTEYLALFEELPPATYLVDATPWHMYSEEAAASIHAMSPEAHIVIGVRNPVDIVASLHNHHVLVGLEPEPDLERAVFGGPRTPDPDEFRRSLDYLSVARFGEQAARFAELFPPEQLHFIATKQLGAEPRRTHLELLSALGVESVALDDYEPFNQALQVDNGVLAWVLGRVAGTARSSRIRRGIAWRISRRIAKPGRTPVSAPLRRRITEALTEDIELFARTSGHDLSAWLDTTSGDVT